MPKEAKVFLVEDDESVRKMLKVFLSREGHQVILEAGSLEEALEGAKKIIQNGVNLAIVDGLLRLGADSAEDGEMVASTLRQEAPGIKIIGLSCLEVNFGDINLKKPVSFRELAKIIKEI